MVLCTRDYLKSVFFLLTMFIPHREIITERHRRRISKTKTSKLKSSLIPNGNYLREFSSITSLHGIMYLGEPDRPLFER